MREPKEFFSTKEFARLICIEPATISRGLCVNGHYMGVRPLKLPNGRLLWPRQSVEKLLTGEDK
jgi:hypothetical protein